MKASFLFADRSKVVELKPQTEAQQLLAYSIPTAARLADISEDTVRRAIACGDLPALRPGRGRGGKILIRRESFEKWLKLLESHGT